MIRATTTATKVVDNVFIWNEKLKARDVLPVVLLWRLSLSFPLLFFTLSLTFPMSKNERRFHAEPKKREKRKRVFFFKVT